MSERKLDTKTRAGGGGGIYEEGAAEARDALLHAEETHATLAFGIETDAVVFDGEDEAKRVLVDEDADMAGVSMFGAVVESFLDDAVDAGFVLFGEIVGEVVVDDIDDEAGALGNFAALPLESGDEAEVVEHGGTKEQGHVADFVDAFFGEELDFLKAVAERAGSLGSPGEIVEVHEESG